MQNEDYPVVITINVNNRGRESVVTIPLGGDMGEGYLDITGNAQDAVMAIRAIAFISENAHVEHVVDMKTGEEFAGFDDLGNPVKRDPLGR